MCLLSMWVRHELSGTFTLRKNHKGNLNLLGALVPVLVVVKKKCSTTAITSSKKKDSNNRNTNSGSKHDRIL